MTTLYLIRHAQAEGNLYRIAQGQFDSYITGQGYRQIDALAERFKDIHIDALYSSDLRRTRATAQAITRYHDLTMHTTPRLREINLGVCEGMSFGDMRKLDPVQMDYFNNDPEKWHCEGAETFAECTERMLSVVTGIAEENDGKTVAVVSHGMAIRSMLARIMGVKSGDISSLPHGDNTAVTLLTYDKGSYKVEYYNDNSHLSDALSTFAKQTWWRKETGGRDDENLSYAPLSPFEHPGVYIDYYRQAWLAAHGDLKFFSADWYLTAAKRHFEREKNSIIGVYRLDELIGILELDCQKGAHASYGWISLICMKDEYRCKGLGIQPLGYAITRFQKLGFKSARLHVSSENEAAVRFYTRCGFEKLGEESGAGAPLYLMEKKFK